jgi:hypothetical protein
MAKLRERRRTDEAVVVITIPQATVFHAMALRYGLMKVNR